MTFTFEGKEMCPIFV